MEVEVLSVSGAAPDQVVSIRAGGQRKQAAVASLGQGTPFRLSTGTNGLNPFRVDILKQVGSARLAVRPEEGSYTIEVQDAGEGGAPVRVGFAVREVAPRSNEDPSHEFRPKVRSKQGAIPSPMKEDEEKRFLSQTTAAKEYLEEHELLPFVRSLLQTVIRDRPGDPYSFIAEQFRLAGDSFKPITPTPGVVDATNAFTEPHLAKATAPELPKLPKTAERPATAPELPKLPKTAQRPADAALPDEAPPQPKETPQTETQRPLQAEDAPKAPAESVESIRLQIREVLGQAAEDGTLVASLNELEPPPAPFAPLKAAEPLVIRRKASPAPEASRAPAVSVTASPRPGVSALEANASLPSNGEATLAKMRIDPDGEEEEAQESGGPLDAMSIASSHEEDTRLAKEKRSIKPPPGASPAKSADKAAEAAAKAAPKEALNEQLESLRQKAQEALLKGAQSGELWELLQRFAARGAGQKVAAVLSEAAQSGELAEALRRVGTAQDAVASAEFDRLRQHAVESLVVAAESGRLLTALKEQAAAGEAELKRQEALLQDAREQVTQAAASGDLALALRSCSGSKEEAKEEEGPDVEQLGVVAREALLMAAESGELAKVLAQATGKEPAPGPKEPASDDALRAAARDALLKGAQSGQLLQELKKGKTRSLPNSPQHRFLPKSPASTIIDELSEASSDPHQLRHMATMHTSVAERLVKEMTDLAAKLGDGNVVEQNAAIKDKIAELKKQYDKLLRERDELKQRVAR